MDMVTCTSFSLPLLSILFSNFLPTEKSGLALSERCCIQPQNPLKISRMNQLSEINSNDVEGHYVGK